MMESGSQLHSAHFDNFLQKEFEMEMLYGNVVRKGCTVIYDQYSIKEMIE